MRHVCALLAALLLCPMSAMADEEPDIKFFYPVVTRRPVIERELEASFQHSKSREGRASQFSGALEWPITPWWQVEVEMPFLYRNPNDAASTAGPGDSTTGATRSATWPAPFPSRTSPSSCGSASCPRPTPPARSAPGSGRPARSRRR